MIFEVLMVVRLMITAFLNMIATQTGVSKELMHSARQKNTGQTRGVLIL
jgi:hypothetical protein